jgi:hypothetical protein
MTNAYPHAQQMQYKLAGFKAPGKTLEETLPQSVKDMCTALGWPCLDEEIHTRRTVQVRTPRLRGLIVFLH